jgi:isoleucyl-tRNA synthetase
VWRCPDGHVTVVGSLAELGTHADRDLADLDPHRPFIDEVTFDCPECGATAARVPEVIDAWYDSGSMPFAQWGYPWTGRAEFERAYPAQFIAEATDQTRGWFYTLMAVGTLVFDRSAYENVLCLGHIQDEQGRKMSKHLGNVLEPIPLMDAHGADAVRWFMAAAGSPWQARRVGHATIQEIVRKVLLTYWNVVSFQSLYARAAGWHPVTSPSPPLEERSLLDRWALSEVRRLALQVDEALEQFNTQRAGQLLSAYLDDLSNWYVRRSRRRFWAGDPGALATLHECLYVVTLLMAPMTPFVTERVWQDLFAATSDELPESVHLAAWPVVDPADVDDALAAGMAQVRRLVELGRATRAAAGVKTRQPLARAMVGAPGWDDLPAELRGQLADELNVVAVEGLDAGEHLVDVVAKPSFRELGRRFGPRTPLVAAAVAAADPAILAAELRDGGRATVLVEGEPVDVGTDEVVLTETPREGWAVATDGGETVALDLQLTPKLRRAGLARDVVRTLQEARKNAGLEVTDRIEATWRAAGELAEALREHTGSIADEVLAVTFAERTEPAGAGLTGWAVGHDAETGLEFAFRRASG